MARMKAPDGSNGCSFKGVEYKTDGNGCVEVPNEAVQVMGSHGFTIATDTSNSDVVVTDEKVITTKSVRKAR